MSSSITQTPELDYLAKDFASFRQLMLQQLALRVPDWQERNPADLGNVMVELLAYAADQLSYYQDAVATEAYLGTARRVSSIGRHARMLDYYVHKGCNARVWVQIQVTDDNVQIPAMTPLFTRTGTSDRGRVLNRGSSEYDRMLSGEALVFQTMHVAQLYQAHNEISLLPSDANQTVLPRGSTQARLCEHNRQPLRLTVGDIVIFEQVRDPATGEVAGADPSLRHAVRLTAVDRPSSHLVKQSLSKAMQSLPFLKSALQHSYHAVDVHWSTIDELPFDLPLLAPLFDDSKLLDVAVARGNIVLADHGRTSLPERLPTVPVGKRYRPYLRGTRITHHVPYDHPIARRDAAQSAIVQQPGAAMPSVELYQPFPRSDGRFDLDELVRGIDSHAWSVRHDLLNSSRFARHYVVEMTAEGSAYLRFGFGNMGKLPLAGDSFVARYRIGNGTVGNVGAGAVANIAVDAELASKISKVRNPMPGQGGTEPENLQLARQHASHAYQHQQRCVTAKDYAAMAKRFPTVVDSVAETVSKGTGQTTLVYVRRIEGLVFDSDFRSELAEFLESYRVIGHEFSLHPPRYVDLQVALTVHAAIDQYTHTLRHEVESQMDHHSHRDGFFRPQNFSFGQSVYQSQIIDRVMAIGGVDQVQLTRFGRVGESTISQTLEIGPAEIARLSSPVMIQMEGGL